ncbi:MAG: hypothetical protein IH942_02230 [Acidobacteria bacterium]|nr:hypothetical protein [Acidobacteriota bacterium]
MVELLIFLASHLGFLLEPDRFRIVDSQSSASFGGDAFVVLESAALCLMVVRERLEISLEFQPAEGHDDDWFGIGVARRYFHGDRPGIDDLDISSVGDVEPLIDELEAQFADETQRSQLLKDLRTAREKRATELFGKP